MAKATVGTTKTISLQLELDTTEAEVLMNMMQNPFHGESLTEEDPYQQRVREAIFTALHVQFYGNDRQELNRQLPHDTKDARDLFPHGGI